MVSMIQLVAHHRNSRFAGSAEAASAAGLAVVSVVEAGVCAGAADSVVLPMGGIWRAGVSAFFTGSSGIEVPGEMPGVSVCGGAAVGAVSTSLIFYCAMSSRTFMN
jgi:hypothetical protein